MMKSRLVEGWKSERLGEARARHMDCIHVS